MRETVGWMLLSLIFRMLKLAFIKFAMVADKAEVLDIILKDFADIDRYILVDD